VLKLFGVFEKTLTIQIMNLPQREHYAYHSRYCEENIWLLCQQPEFAASDVIVIAATQAECFPILCQRAADAPDQPLLWYYHVVLLWSNSEQTYLIDFDTTLPFCTPVTDYFQSSFLDEETLYPEFIPLFRVMPAQDYVRILRSDRSHMRTKNGWQAPPPHWPVISANESNLHQFTDMNDREYGQIFTAAELLKTYHPATK